MDIVTVIFHTWVLHCMDVKTWLITMQYFHVVFILLQTQFQKKGWVMTLSFFAF